MLAQLLAECAAAGWRCRRRALPFRHCLPDADYRPGLARRGAWPGAPGWAGIAILVWLALGLGCGMLPARCASVGNARHCAADTAVMLSPTAASLAAYLRRPDRCRPALAGAGVAAGRRCADRRGAGTAAGSGGWQEWRELAGGVAAYAAGSYFQHYAEGRALGRFALLGLGWRLLLFIWQWPAWSMVVAHEQRLQAHKQRLANRQAAARCAGEPLVRSWPPAALPRANLRLRELVLVEQFADEIRRNRIGNPRMAQSARFPLRP